MSTSSQNGAMRVVLEDESGNAAPSKSKKMFPKDSIPFVLTYICKYKPKMSKGLVVEYVGRFFLCFFIHNYGNVDFPPSQYLVRFIASL